MCVQSEETSKPFLIRSRPGRLVIPAVAFCPLFLVTFARAQDALKVEWKEGRLSVTAEGIPLSQVLQEVSSQTGLEAGGLERLQEKVSVRFSNLPLREGLQRLLASVNYVILEKKSAQGDTRPVLVLASGRRTTPLSGEQGGKPEEEPTIEGDQGRRLASNSSAGGPSFTPSPMVNYLQVNVGSAWLIANQENYIFADNIWPPGHANYTRQPLLLPGPNPPSGVFWGVVFTPAAYTVRNTTNRPVDVLWNVYSDNSYTYQGLETIPPQSYRTMNFGTMQFGYIYGPNPPGSVGPTYVGPLNPKGEGMSLVIGLSPGAPGVIGYWDTRGPTPLYPNLGRVSGSSVTLTPLCQLPDCR